jgi:hypothetical protein
VQRRQERYLGMVAEGALKSQWSVAVSSASSRSGKRFSRLLPPARQASLIRRGGPARGADLHSPGQYLVALGVAVAKFRWQNAFWTAWRPSATRATGGENKAELTMLLAAAFA